MATFTYSNETGVAIPEYGLATPSFINAMGAAGAVTNVSVFLSGLTHGWVGDVDMLLLGPDGASNLLFWSDVSNSGNSVALNAADFVLSDAEATYLPQSGAFPSGSYKPTDYLASESGAGFGLGSITINYAGPKNGTSATFASSFNGKSAAGTWGLYIADDTGPDAGTLAGWGLSITTSTNTAYVGGTSGDDTIQVIRAGVPFLGNGIFTVNDEGVSFSGVTGTFEIDMGAGDDTILGSKGNEIITGWHGLDTIRAGAGDDVIRVAQGDTVAGELYDGGAGHDVLQITSITGEQIDLRGTTLKSIEELRFNIDYAYYPTIQLEASQIGGSGLSNTATIAKTGQFYFFPVGLDVTMGSETSVNLSGFVFHGFDKYDGLTIRGDDDKETITGSSLSDRIYGGGNKDVLVGGAGSDTLIGGAGSDTLTGGTDAADVFVFDFAPSTTLNTDKITDFQVGLDQIQLDDAVFAAITADGTGHLTATEFRIGTKALDGDDHIIYDQAKGKLYYDADGSGAQAQVQFASVTAKLGVNALDILVV